MARVAIRERTGALAFSDLGGLAKPMPVLGFCFGLAAFASIGLPGFANFASDRPTRIELGLGVVPI